MANLKTLKQFRGQEVDSQKQYRVGEDVLVMFTSKDQIFVRNLETEHVRLYHRGMQIKGTYKEWKKFRQCLRTKRRLTDQDAYDLGLKFEIDCMSTRRRPILDETYKKVGR